MNFREPLKLLLCELWYGTSKEPTPVSQSDNTYNIPISNWARVSLLPQGIFWVTITNSLCRRLELLSPVPEITFSPTFKGTINSPHKYAYNGQPELNFREPLKLLLCELWYGTSKEPTPVSQSDNTYNIPISNWARVSLLPQGIFWVTITNSLCRRLELLSPVPEITFSPTFKGTINSRVEGLGPINVKTTMHKCNNRHKCNTD